MASYLDRLPATRPPGLRLSTLRRSWWRIDAEQPESWQWSAFASPCYRFDSSAGAFRTRYAADAQRAAMRERFDEVGRFVSAPDLDRLRVVELVGKVTVLDLRTDRTLDALGLDDQINTSRHPEVWRSAQLLADLVHSWFGERCGAIAYRSRTTPQRACNLALFEHSGLTALDRGVLGDHQGLLAALILSDGFAVERF